ncbi:MAG: YdcF family protein [Campylobacterales bacterium]|nr:YdcF family protein [Campylobacterales bacterium]
MLKWIGIIVVGILLSFIGINAMMTHSAKADIYTDLRKIPPKKAVLLLGTAKYIAKGKPNYFYTYRIQAAEELFKAGKVKAIVVSGDNGTKYYNETIRMQKDLIKAGVPKKYIALDYAGFRTLDSIVRAKEIFDLDDYIIVSQRFHLERALFLSKQKGQKAIGFAAKDIPGTAAAYRMKTREYFARMKAFLDIYLLDTKPKFFGKKVQVIYHP